MDINLMLPLKLLVVWSLLLIHCCFSSNFPIAKPGCRDRCGDVGIPFPFGIGEGCYYPEENNFDVQCNSSDKATSPQLSLVSGSIGVKKIWLEGQFEIMQYVGYDCYDDAGNKGYNSPHLYIGRPYILNSTANKFVVIGCDSYADARGQTFSGEYTVGCGATCTTRGEVQDGSCVGTGCCQTSVPISAFEINVSLSSYSNHKNVSSFNPCTYAFVVANDAFQFSVDNLTNLYDVESVPVAVDWVISYINCTEAQSNLTSYACGLNSECYIQDGALGYRCRCDKGYEGNPYLGCQDIDECANPNQCGNYSDCTNKPGSFECNCTQGYHEDGDADGRPRCVANDKKNNLPIIVGVCVSGGAASLLIFSFCFYFEWMRRKEKRSRENFFRKNGGFILQEKISTPQGGGTYVKIFTHEELQKATNDFDESQIIGHGGFGTVFKGELIDKSIVAIKKSRGVDERQVEQFINEVILLSRINSRYVVKLLGCCLETEVPLLVYEYIDNGTLFEHLHNNVKASKLTWNIRLRIASEIAGVLSYLHSMASPPIIHRDIKSTNILLDHNYTAKVSDFGISKLILSEDDEVATMVQGTLGYLDPEYMQTGMLTEKSDVYSFGVVLIELLTGKKVVAYDKPEAEKFLANRFLTYLKKGNHLSRVVDSNISFPEHMEQVNEVAMVAERCISVKGEDRPSMRDVERELVLLASKAKEISIQVFEIDSSKSEALRALESTGNGSVDYSISTGQYSGSYVPTEQPLLPVFGGR